MANDGLWQQVLKLNGQETAQRAKCRYLSDSQSYIITLLNREYTVELSEKKIPNAGFAEELSILTCLINSKDLPVANKLKTAHQLPEGQFFFRGHHKLATEKLEEAFGQFPERLYDIMDKFGGIRREFGDASIELYVLPRVPLTIVIWRGDEEFGARASVLFDETAAEQMPLDALWVSANLAIKTLAKEVTSEKHG
ncbi:MAG: DUF3786 domain-containing protein [Phycisphaerae bacterium]|nr:DUF3786 domain-containing protein [Phycisphaerae bacterium]